MEVAVVGGGVTGLVTALEMGRRGVSWQLYEARPRLGGVVRTDRVDGHLLDAGPDTLLAQKPDALALCGELGLAEDLRPTNPQERAIFVLRGGRLHRLPVGTVLGVPARPAALLGSRLFSWAGRARMACEPFVPPRPPRSDESIAAFVRRRLGRECLDRLAGPFLAGIHAGDAECLSLRATFPRLAEMEVREGSVARGLLKAARKAPPSAPAFYALRHGMGSLVDALVSHLPGDRIHAGRRVLALRREHRGYALDVEEEGVVHCRAVVLAAPAPESARLLSPFDPGAAALLAQIRFASSAAVFLGYERSQVGHPLDGYGAIVAETEGLRTRACSFVSTKFAGRAPAGHVLLRAVLGGMRDPLVLEATDDELARTAVAELQRPLGLEGPPGLVRVFRWPHATPQMEVGHLARINALERRLAASPGVVLAGSGLRGTGIPDCVTDGRRAAGDAEQSLAA